MEAFDKRRKLIVGRLNDIEGVKCINPQGAFYAFPDVSSFNGRKTPDGTEIKDDLGLCEYLINDGKIAVVPGSAFFAPGFVRLSYATSEANIEKGLDRMKEALGKLA